MNEISLEKGETAVLMKRWHKGQVSWDPRWFQGYCFCGWTTEVLEGEWKEAFNATSEKLGEHVSQEHPQPDEED